MQYIEEVIFCGEQGESLISYFHSIIVVFPLSALMHQVYMQPSVGLVSRTDMEMLLLSELGTNYTAHVLHQCMNMICKSNVCSM